MKPVEKIALIERIARGLAWSELSGKEQQDHRTRAETIVTEMMVAYEQHERIGWVFVEGEEVET